MALVLCCTNFVQTGVIAASAETETEVVQEAVQEQVVEKTEEELIAETVADPSLAFEIEQGAAFDVQKDFTGLGLKDGDKAELKKAALEDGSPFDPGRPGTYKCVYRITPKDGDSYLVARTITVTEKEPETQAAGDSGTEESGECEDPDPLPEQPIVVGEISAEEENQDSTLTEVPADSEDLEETVDTVENPEGDITEPEEGALEDDGFGSEILPEDDFDSELERVRSGSGMGTAARRDCV